jgi:hypothetical protein
MTNVPVVAPPLGHAVGNWAFVAMLGIVLTACAVGSAVRYNICHVEEIAGGERDDGTLGATLRWLERAAKVVLAIVLLWSRTPGPPHAWHVWVHGRSLKSGSEAR